MNGRRKFNDGVFSFFQTKIKGLSGHIEFDNFGRRRNFELQVMETYKEKELAKVRRGKLIGYQYKMCESN